MGQYKLIEKWLGIEIYNLHAYEGFFFVSADKLEAKLAEGFELYNSQDVHNLWDDELSKVDNQVALAIGKQPIKKKTREEAALELLEKIVKDPAYYQSLVNAEAKEILEMK